MALQQSAGNHAVGRLLREEATLSVDAKARVGNAFAFWRHQLTQASPAEAQKNLASPPAGVRGTLPSDAPAKPAEAAAEPARRRNTPEESERARAMWKGVAG